jgi:hypothetical protein
VIGTHGAIFRGGESGSAAGENHLVTAKSTIFDSNATYPDVNL